MRDINARNGCLSKSLFHQSTFKHVVLLALLSTCLLAKEAGSEAPVVTSIGFMFETFSPYTLIRFFEFSDREWNITEGCFADMYEYVEGLRHNEYWALKRKTTVLYFC